MDFQHYLWWPEGDTTKPMAEYRMNVHIFSATSSPSCANHALKRTAADNTDTDSNIVTTTINNNFYVDDLLKSVATINEGKILAAKLIDTCNKGGFRLTKWISNQRQLLESIPESERALEVKDIDLESDNLPTERALGMKWNVEADTFGFQNKYKEKPATRRGILSLGSSIYDPCTCCFETQNDTARFV
ncbi:uncharacterized protein LOC102809433 [Saccoglossus kowalevskii]|uniref:Uncharacterized protein LOC102809433 n=1 Tax=Saccoglossus kowalevskii TaxID=10224 RepID=A0ABM0MS60_SACKO|nr:PREDICTED: uncharacterized protein LOC102809433 [Saccoglossus kowalevskii]